MSVEAGTVEGATSGTVAFKVGDETYQTWYMVLGDLTALKPGIRPVVLLHGGPGIPHHGLLNHDILFHKFGIPVVWYDQLGCGASTHLNDKPASFWTRELFMDELENLLAHLGIASAFDIIGHSWGGMLGAEWAARRHPPGLKKLVIMCAPASMREWEKATWNLLLTMPQEEQEIVKKSRAGELPMDSPEYKAAMRKYFTTFVCRCDPWPEAVTLSHKLMGENPKVTVTMCGEDEFDVSGNLKGWDITDIIHTITASTLIVNGRWDMAQDNTVWPFFQKIPKVKWVKCSASSHMPYWEEPEFYYESVGGFLVAE